MDPTADRPLYRQVADILRDDIRSGELGPGQILPSEAHLRHEYGVGKNTVREALAVLRAEALVVTQRGRGTRVRETIERTVVNVPPGSRIIVRAPTDLERRNPDLAGSVRVVEVTLPDGTTQVLPGDETAIETRGSA